MKYQRFAQSGCKDIGIRRFEFVAKTQLLYVYTLPSLFIDWYSLSRYDLKTLFKKIVFFFLSYTKRIEYIYHSLCSYTNVKVGIRKFIHWALNKKSVAHIKINKRTIKDFLA